MFEGIGLLCRGIARVLRRRRLFGLGLIPPLVTSVLMIGLLVLLGMNLGRLADWLVPFAARGGQGGELLRGLVMLALFGGALLLLVLTFTAVTLALGDPIYEQVSRRIDEQAGPLPAEAREKPVAMVARVAGQVLITVLLSAIGGVVCFLLGLIPVAGAVVGAVASMLFGGWMTVRELTGAALERRGRLRLGERAAVLRRRPAMALGFGIPAFWLLAIPGVAVLVFPGAVAGATLLVRRLLGEPIGD